MCVLHMCSALLSVLVQCHLSVTVCHPVSCLLSLLSSLSVSQDEQPCDFVLVETSPATSYIPVELDPSEVPWVRLQELRKVSLRNFVNIRYALKRRITENWTTVFISGLPKERLKNQASYTKLFMDIAEEGG